MGVSRETVTSCLAPSSLRCRELGETDTPVDSGELRTPPIEHSTCGVK